jgi:hypothetical protein
MRNADRVDRFRQADTLEQAHHLMVDIDGAGLVVNVRHLVDYGNREPIRAQQIGEHRPHRAKSDNDDIILISHRHFPLDSLINR